MRAILDVFMLVLNMYTYIIIGSAIFSWLFAFGVINANNQFVSMVGNFLHQATEPLLRPIRRMMPNLGNIDISPIILLLGIFLLQRIVVHYIYPTVY